MIEGFDKLTECVTNLMDSLDEEAADPEHPNYRVVDAAVIVAVEWDSEEEGVSGEGWTRFYCSTPHRHRQFGLFSFAAKAAALVSDGSD